MNDESYVEEVMKMNFNTTVGKFIISLAFAVATLIVAQVTQFVTNNSAIFSPFWLLVINAVLFGVKNFLNPNVKNI